MQRRFEYCRTVGLIAAGLGIVVAGCKSVGPDYQAPELPDPKIALADAGMPETGKSGEAAQKRSEITEAEIGEWWKVFGDEDLNRLIERAFAHNLTLKGALARVRQARAQLAAAEGTWKPIVDAGGTIKRFGTSKYGQTGANLTRNLYNGGFDASWEIDIFGGTRRTIEAAEANLEGAIAGVEQIWVTQAAEVANNYAHLRTVQQRLLVARRNLDTQSETFEILDSRLKSGIGDELAVQQSRYNVETTRATIPLLMAQEEAYLNALAVLVGEEPGLLHEQLKTVKPQLTMQPKQLVGISAEYLRRRPDLAQAERALAAQTARVGAAVADLYPKFFLNGSIGLESLKAHNFFDNNSDYWSIGPSVSWPIFHGGTIRANIALQDAMLEEAYTAYDTALLNAVREIRDALSAYSQEYHRYQSLSSAVAAAKAAVNISQDLYKSGLRDFNNVLDAQRSLLTLEESFTVSQGNIATSLISLYKALGGGWSSWGDDGVVLGIRTDRDKNRWGERKLQ